MGATEIGVAVVGILAPVEAVALAVVLVTTAERVLDIS